MSMLTIFLFVWGFAISIYLIAIGISKFISHEIRVDSHK